MHIRPRDSTVSNTPGPVQYTPTDINKSKDPSFTLKGRHEIPEKPNAAPYPYLKFHYHHFAKIKIHMSHQQSENMHLIQHYQYEQQKQPIHDEKIQDQKHRFNIPMSRYKSFQSFHHNFHQMVKCLQCIIGRKIKLLVIYKLPSLIIGPKYTIGNREDLDLEPDLIFCKVLKKIIG